MKKVDLHIHTCASDGTCDVYELKDEIKKNKIEIFSITDHDSIDNIENMKKIIVPGDNMIFIPGVELSTIFEGREYHLTLYNYEMTEELLKLIKENNENKINTNQKFIENYIFPKYNNVTGEEYEKYEYDRKRGGWKSVNFLIDKGIHSDVVSHLKDFEKSGLKAKMKSPEEVIEISKRSGGKIFLAHPSYHYRNGYMPEEELKYWLSLGIDGIECFSPYNENKTEDYINFCKKNNLMISGGSDYHGAFIQSRSLGKPDVDLDDLNIGKLLN